MIPVHVLDLSTVGAHLDHFSIGPFIQCRPKVAAKAKSEAKGTKEVKKLSKDSRHHSAVAGKWLCGRFFFTFGNLGRFREPIFGDCFLDKRADGKQEKGDVAFNICGFNQQEWGEDQ